jgi:hypothetical protein
MQQAKLWTMALLFGVTFTAAATTPDQELFRAARSGNVEAVQAALQAGANVNARFDIGKTALIVAAERGHSATVEALINAGADLYALDNNYWDALAHAGEGQHISTFKALLAKGFDPSKNNWRALTIMRGQSSASAFLRQSQIRAMEAQRILEKMHTASPRGPDASVSASSGSVVSSASFPFKEVGEPILMDISERKVTPEMFQAAAMKAFLGRGWKITQTGSDHLAATLVKDQEYRAAIVLKPSLIRISFIDGFGSSRQNWLLNLRQDLERELGATRR